MKWLLNLFSSLLPGDALGSSSHIASKRNPTREPKHLAFEPLEARTLLSGSLTADLVAVNNTAALTGFTTSDIQVTSTSDWSSASLVMNLSQGTIYQDPAGGTTAPNPATFASFPTLEFDTSLGGDLTSILTIAAPTDLGQSRIAIRDKILNIAWANQTGGDTGTFDIARITLTDNAAGTWSLHLTADEYGFATYSGTITAGSFNTTTAPVIPAQAVDSDFTGDGHTDTFWHNKQTGRNAISVLNRGIRTATIEVRRLRNTDWKLVGTGDFTGDGKNDLLWRNARTGQNAVWEMNGTTFAANHLIRQRGSTDWRISGAGDFTGDGKQDILWRHSKRGTNSIWEMDGLVFQNNTPIKPVANPNWWVAGIADFTGDGKDDIFWQDQTNKAMKTIWKMNGTSFQRRINFEQSTRPLLDIAGFADFDGDGMADLLWRSPNGGGVSNWHLNLTNVVSGGVNLNDRWDDVNWQPAGSLALRDDLV